MAQFLDYTGLGHFKDKNDALYAKQDGSYEGMTVGNAEQLVSTVGVEDSAPYTFRTTGGSADVGDRMNFKAVIGGTVAWNQLLDKSNYPDSTGIYTNNGDGSVTANGTPSGTTTFKFAELSNSTFVLNHAYLIISGLKATGSDSTFELMIGYFVGNSSVNLYGYATIKKYTHTGTNKHEVQAVVRDGYTASNLTWKPMIFDLTAMFGSTIADYVYTLESGTAGAGVAWLKKYGFFTKPYYPYAAANLQSVKTSAHKTIGFNQWDEVWEANGINPADGTNTNTSNSIRSKNYIRVVPNTVYYFKCAAGSNAYVFGYDENKNFVKLLKDAGNSSYISNETFAVPDGVYFIRFSYPVTGSTYNHDICINLHWDGERDGEYEPYEQHTYALDDVELRGIPKLDASNNLYYDGDTYEADGTVTRYWGERAYTSGDVTDGSTMITDGTNTVYKLTTPTTESADAYTELQICDDFGTEEFVDAATRDFEMPCGSLAVYRPNLRAKLEMSPNSPSDGNGDYIVRQTNGTNEYVLFSEVKELPDYPTEDGTYVLKCTVADGTATLSWVSE